MTKKSPCLFENNLPPPLQVLGDLCLSPVMILKGTIFFISLKL